MDRFVEVTYNDKRKRIPVYPTFDELEQRCRAKLDIPDGKIEIKAQVSSGHRLNVDDDEDLEAAKQDVEAFHIRSFCEGSKSVIVKGGNYQIDQIPHRDSTIVLKYGGELRTDEAVGLQGKLRAICHVADLFQLSATAMHVHRDVDRVHALQNASYDLIVYLTELSHDSDIFYTKSTVTCGLVLDSVMIAANFHLDGFSDVAAQELATLGSTTRGMVEQCLNLVKKVEEGRSKLGKIRIGVDDKRLAHQKSKETLEDLRGQIEKKHIDVDRTREDYNDAKSGATGRHGRADDLREKLSTAAGVSAATSTGVAAFIGSGLIEGTLAMSMPVVGVPLALISLTGGLLYACNKTITDMNAQQLQDEALIAEKRKQEAEVKKELLDLKRKLEHLQSVDVEHVELCIHTLNGQLKLLESTLQLWAAFWARLAVIFLQKQRARESRFASYSNLLGDEDRLRELMYGDNFRMQLVKYMALWVAFREHSEEMQRGIQANIGPLHRLMERNLTRVEAEHQLRNVAGRKGD